MKDNSDWVSQLRAWIQLSEVRRVIVLVLIVELLALALGVAFILIINGLIVGLFYLATFWMPANMLLNRVAGVKDVQSRFVSVSPWWMYIRFSLQLAIRALMVVAGIWILLQSGFCNQNIICLLLMDR